jgi:peptide/nickel transport system permease protein
VLRARYLLGRLVQSGVTLIGVTAVLFAILHAIPGGPLRAIVGEAAGVDPAALRRAEALLGFDRPLLERYAAWLRALLSGDLGTSWTVAPGRPVGPLLGDALGNTLLLTGTALVVAVALGGCSGRSPPCARARRPTICWGSGRSSWVGRRPSGSASS